MANRADQYIEAYKAAGVAKSVEGRKPTKSEKKELNRLDRGMKSMKDPAEIAKINQALTEHKQKTEAEFRAKNPEKAAKMAARDNRVWGAEAQAKRAAASKEINAAVEKRNADPREKAATAAMLEKHAAAKAAKMGRPEQADRAKARAAEYEKQAQSGAFKPLGMDDVRNQATAAKAPVQHAWQKGPRGGTFAYVNGKKVYK